MGFFSSIVNFVGGAFKGATSLMTGVGRAIGIIPPDMSAQRSSIEKMQKELAASTAKQKADADAVNASAAQRSSAVRGRTASSRKRRSVLFAERNQSGLEKTLG